MSSISDILGQKNFDEPPEIQLIKDFVREKFQTDVAITVQPKQIIITVNSASLAGTLRLHSYELAQICQTDKRLIFRIRY